MKVEHKESEVEKLFDHTQKVGNLYFLNFAIVFKNTNVTSRRSSSVKTQKGTSSAVCQKDVLKLLRYFRLYAS